MATQTLDFNPSYGAEQNDTGYWDYNGTSQDPSTATNGPTEAAAQAAWFAANPGYAADNNASASGPNLTGGSPQPPTGLPSPDQLTSDAPLPISAFGATPTVTPTYANSTGYSASTIDPNKQYGYLQAQEAANAASLAPTFQAQDQSNEDQLKARGISSSGSAAEITNQLKTQQGATLAGMNAPAIAQQSGYTQSDLQGNQTATNAARQYNATNDLNTNIFNAGEGTAASGTNAGYYAGDRSGDATAYNGYQSTLEGQGYNTSNEAYTAWLNSFGPNSGVTSGYNGAVSGVGSTYGNVYSSANAAQGAAIGGALGAAGTAYAAGK